MRLSPFLSLAVLLATAACDTGPITPASHDTPRPLLVKGDNGKDKLKIEKKKDYTLVAFFADDGTLLTETEYKSKDDGRMTVYRGKKKYKIKWKDDRGEIAVEEPNTRTVVYEFQGGLDAGIAQFVQQYCSCSWEERELWDAIRDYFETLTAFTAACSAAFYMGGVNPWADVVCAGFIPSLMNAHYVIIRAMDDLRSCLDRCEMMKDPQFFRSRSILPARHSPIAAFV